MKQKKKIQTKNWLRGSYTVEGAVVFSLVFFVLAACLIAAFYVHDRAVLQAVTCEAVSVSTNFLTAKERSKAAAAVKKQLKQTRLLGSRQLSGNASAGSKTVTAAWSASYPVPGIVMRYLKGNRLKIQTQWKGTIRNPSATVRMIRGAGALLAGGDQ